MDTFSIYILGLKAPDGMLKDWVQVARNIVSASRLQLLVEAMLWVYLLPGQRLITDRLSFTILSRRDKI